MKIKTSITAEDCAHWADYGLATPPMRALLRNKQLGISACAAVVIFFSVHDKTHHLGASLIIALLVAVAFYWWARSFVHNSTKKALVEALSGEEGAPWEQAVEITKTGVNVQTNEVSSKIQWKTVHEIVFTTRHVFIIHTGGDSVIIPLRAFPSPEQKSSFVETLKHYAKDISVTQ